MKIKKNEVEKTPFLLELRPASLNLTIYLMDKCVYDARPIKTAAVLMSKFRREMNSNQQSIMSKGFHYAGISKNPEENQ